MKDLEKDQNRVEGAQNDWMTLLMCLAIFLWRALFKHFSTVVFYLHKAERIVRLSLSLKFDWNYPEG